MRKDGTQQKRKASIFPFLLILRENTHTQEYKRSINKDKHRADGRMVMVLT